MVVSRGAPRADAGVIIHPNEDARTALMAITDRSDDQRLDQLVSLIEAGGHLIDRLRRLQPDLVLWVRPHHSELGWELEITSSDTPEHTHRMILTSGPPSA